MSPDVGAAAFPGEGVHELRALHEAPMALKFLQMSGQWGALGTRGALRAHWGHWRRCWMLRGIAGMGDTEGLGDNGDKVGSDPLVHVDPNPIGRWGQHEVTLRVLH